MLMTLTNANTTTADNTIIVKATTANDSRAQINPMEKQMVPEKVNQLQVNLPLDQYK